MALLTVLASGMILLTVELIHSIHELERIDKDGSE
jgi:hypothetical protein